MVKRGAFLALGLVIAFFVLATVAWIHADTVPPLWDQAQYLQESELLYHTLRQQGPIAFLSAFSETLKIKAPLITALPLPFYFLFGESHLAARYVNVVFVVLASWFLFRLGELVAGRRAALLSVIILNTFPLVAGMSRQVLVEYGLMTLVILWMYYLVRWWQGDERRPSWALGIVLGFGLLMKVSFPLYVAAPTVLVLAWDMQKHRRLRSTTLVSMACVAAAAVAIAGIWYFKNLTSVLGFVRKAGYGEWAHAYGKGSVFSLRTVGAYWLDLINRSVGAYWFLLLVVVACWLGLGLVRRENRSGMARDRLVLLLAWWIVPWLALTFAVSKDHRFSAPYLPALALLLGAGCVEICRRRLGLAGLAVIAVGGLLNYTYYSFAARGTELRAAGLLLLSNQLGWAHPPISERWPNESIARMVTADAAKLRIARPRTTVLFSHPRLNAHNLNYLSVLEESPVRFNTCSFQAVETASELASRIRMESDYVLMKSGSLGSDLLNTKNVEVLDLLQRGGFPFERMGAVELPDHSELSIFRRQEHGYKVWRKKDYASSHPLAAERAARFGQRIALVASEVTVEDHGLRIKLVWEGTAAMAEDYRVFVHAFDALGRVHANADHDPAKGIHPTSRWQVGEIVEEEIWLPKAPPTGVRIYVGWYQLERRFQLPVEGGGAAEAGEPNGVRIL